MPGHSYKGSTAHSPSGPVLPPLPVAGFDDVTGNWKLTASVAASGAGRPTFEAFTSVSGTGDPTTDPGEWIPATFIMNSDGGGNYVAQYAEDSFWIIGRTRYGFNVSAWSNKFPSV